MLANTGKLLFRRLSMTPLARFSNGKWKEREETAENLYINQSESTLLSIQNKSSRSSLGRWRTMGKTPYSSRGRSQSRSSKDNSRPFLEDTKSKTQDSRLRLIDCTENTQTHSDYTQTYHQSHIKITMNNILSDIIQSTQRELVLGQKIQTITIKYKNSIISLAFVSVFRKSLGKTMILLVPLWKVLLLFMLSVCWWSILIVVFFTHLLKLNMWFFVMYFMRLVW